MPQTSRPNPLGPLNPLSDGEAARLATPATHTRLVAELMTDLDHEWSRRSVRSGVRFARFPRGWRRPALVASVITAAAAIVLLLPGLLAGSGSATEPAVAQAQLLAHISAALSRPGTIVIEQDRVHDFAGGYTQRNVTFSVENITETSASGRQQRTFVTGSYMRPGYQNVWTSSWEAVYDPADNTIYTGAENNGEPGLAPDETSVFKQELDEHLYRPDGTSMVDGRAALKLVPVAATIRSYGGAAETYATVYVSPKTYYPLRSVTPAPPGSRVRVAEVTDWLAYRVVPATAASRRLVSLSTRHPHARVVNNIAAMQHVYRREDTK